MKVSFELPDIQGVDNRFLKEGIVAILYSTGKISERQAREALGMTGRAFQEMLPRYGFSVLVDSQRNVELELSE